MRLRCRGGQIVIPAMLIFPALMLFVFLIYETAKLSREKIRHQFAMDAAVFVEMTNYSDFLNRTAYVNGAFPMRIFDEAYGNGGLMTTCLGKTDSCTEVPYSTLLFNNGVFPHLGGVYPTTVHQPESEITADKWEIRYGGLGATKNTTDPDLVEPLQIFTREDTKIYWNSKELAFEIVKFYVQIYALLGSVEDAQYTVLKRLVGDHSFIKKSYWLNTGEPEGDQLAANFRASSLPDFTSSSVVKPKCQKTYDCCGNVLTGSGLQPYRPECVTGGGSDPPAKLDTSAGCAEGLFQFMYIQKGAIDAVRNGIPLFMHWAIPAKNYWNVDLYSEMVRAHPEGTLHTTITLKGDPNSKPAVWPDPTPKFQVRQYP